MHGLQQSSLAMNAKLRPCSIKHVFRSGKRTQRLPHAASSKVTASSTFPNRRDMLTVTGGGVLLAGLQAMAPPAGYCDGLEKKTVAVQYLSALQKNAQRKAFRVRAEQELKKVLRAGDAPATLRLLLHDAATYDIATGTGGLNGSIVTSEELSRPENEDLKSTVQKLQAAKNAIDAKSAEAGITDITWADLIVLGAKVAAESSWRAAKASRLGAGADIDTISSAFGADFPVVLGRQDSATADSAGRVPPRSASPIQVKEFLATLGTAAGGGGGLFSAKPLFWERPAFVLWTAAQPDPAKAEEEFAAADPAFAGLKVKYDRSRATVTRTDYEVDFIDFFTRASGSKVGAKFDQDRYLIPLALELPRL